MPNNWNNNNPNNKNNFLGLWLSWTLSSWKIKWPMTIGTGRETVLSGPSNIKSKQKVILELFQYLSLQQKSYFAKVVPPNIKPI